MNPKNLVHLRILSQVLFFVFLVIFITGAVCAFSLGDKQVFSCTLGMLQITIGSRTLIGSVIASGLVLIALTIILGRVFCSWVCPFGSLLDWLHSLLKKVRLNKEISGESIVTNKNNKYGILAGVFISAGILRSPAFCTICPIGTTCRSAGVQGAMLGLEAAIVPLIAGLEFVRRRFWCKFLCPVGALLAITDRFSLLKVKLPSATCLRCGRCDKACSMDVKPWQETHKNFKKDPLVLDALMAQGIPDFLDRPVPFRTLDLEVQDTLLTIGKKHQVSGGECTRCYDCNAVCPILQDGKSSSISSPVATETA